MYSPSETLHDEQHSAISPSDIYGLTKLHGEQYVRYFALNRRLAAVIVRLSNVAGLGETNPHLLPEMVAQMKAGYDHVRLDNLWPKRNYIHVSDAAAGFAAAAIQGAVAPSEAFTVNLGTSRQYSVIEIIDRLKAIFGQLFSVDQDPGCVVDRPFLEAAIGEIQHHFGWTPKYSIDDAIADLWREPDLAAELTRKYQLTSPACE